MKFRKTFFYKDRVFEPCEISRACSEALYRLEIDPSSEAFTVHECLPDGTNVNHEVTLSDLETICDLKKEVLFYLLSPHFVFFSLSSHNDDLLILSVEASDISSLDILHKVFEEKLSLEKAPLEKENEGSTTENNETLQSIVRRLDALESIVLAPSRRLRCFSSYRFSDTNEVPALRIKQFLSLLNVEVLSGASYEPRKVSEKVLSKLRQPLEFIVLLLTAEGESMWTRDEIAAAIHKGIALVPLVEKGAKLTPGLLADIEYVEFPKGCIGEAFLKLLEAVCFIREQKLLQPVSLNPRDTAGEERAS